MSKLGSKDNSFGKNYSITIANGTEEQMSKISNLGIYNSIIISVPQTNGSDDINKASLWITDSEGNLLELSAPIQRIIDLENRINDLENTIGAQ